MPSSESKIGNLDYICFSFNFGLTVLNTLFLIIFICSVLLIVRLKISYFYMFMTVLILLYLQCVVLCNGKVCILVTICC